MEINQRPAIAYPTFHYHILKSVMETRRNRTPVDWDICPVAENGSAIGIACNDFKDPKMFAKYCNGNHEYCPKKSGGNN